MADGFLLLPNLTLGPDGAAGPVSVGGLALRSANTILELRQTGGLVNQREWIVFASGADGTFRIRPTLDNSNTATGGGDIVLDRSGSFTVPGNVVAAGSAFIGSSSAAVLGPSGTNANGTIFLRPDGATDTTGQVVITTSGISGNGSGLTSLNGSQLLSGTVPSARVSGVYASITGTGALNSGSITSGFGNINIGPGTFTGQVGVFTSATPIVCANMGGSTGTDLIITGTGQILKLISSIRYKNNITSVIPNVERFLKLQPKRFDYRGDGAKHVLGFVAEDAHELGLTELLNYDEQGCPESFRQHAFNAYVLQALKMCLGGCGSV